MNPSKSLRLLLLLLDQTFLLAKDKQTKASLRSRFPLLLLPSAGMLNILLFFLHQSLFLLHKTWAPAMETAAGRPPFPLIWYFQPCVNAMYQLWSRLKRRRKGFRADELDNNRSCSALDWFYCVCLAWIWTMMISLTSFQGSSLFSDQSLDVFLLKKFR